MKLLLFLIFLFIIPFAKAAGIAVSPDKISFQAEEKGYGERQIIAYNLNNEDMQFSVISEKHPEIFEIIPDNGILSKNGNEKITIKLKPGLKPGNYEDSFVIKLHSKEKGMAVNVGAAIKAKIKIMEPILRKSDFTGPLITLGIVAIGVFAHAAFKRV